MVEQNGTETEDARKAAEAWANGAKEFWLEVGRTLDVWQRCEEYLCDIYVLIVQATLDDVVRASFYKVISTNTRRQMITAALSVRLEDKAVNKAWSELSEDVGKWARKRNILAHSMRWDHNGVSVMGPHIRDVLALDRMQKATDDELLDAKSINKLQGDFWQLARKLERFHFELGGHLLSFGKPINLPRGRS